MFTKEALQLLFDEANGQLREVDGEFFSTKPLYRPLGVAPVDPIEGHSLLGVLDYLVRFFDGDTVAGGILGTAAVPETRIVVLVDAFSVIVSTGLQADNRRFHLFRAQADIDAVPVFTNASLEIVQLELRRLFERTDELSRLLSFLASVGVGAVLTAQDDGVSQEVTLVQGIQRKSAGLVRPYWTLQPIVGFPEIHRPPVEYVLRMKGRDNQEPLVTLQPMMDPCFRQKLADENGVWLNLELNRAKVPPGKFAVVCV